MVQALARRNVKAAERATTDKAAKDKLKEAVTAVRAFHQKLCETRVLDPACGSGNFLYVTLDLFKRLEGEVLAALDGLGEKQTVMHMESVRVTPAQFHGIEIKRWAKEIAELVLWIGYLQWHFRIYGKNLPVPEPVLHDYKNIECRDAVLAYDGEPELVRDEKGKPVTRWDGETMKTNPVTGEKVPDESARVNVYKYKNPRKAEWPEADFIVGNPPFVGAKNIRTMLGGGYAEALRSAHPDVGESSDLVMYWWNTAAKLAQQAKVRRFGFITTNSIKQTFNRRVLERYLTAEPPISLLFAVPDHPWVDSADGAAVRIAMTVGVAGDAQVSGTLAVVSESEAAVDGIAITSHTGRIGPDLTVGVDMTASISLESNQGLSFQGMKPHGEDFWVTPEQAVALGIDRIPDMRMHLRPYRNGKDLTATARGIFVLDFFGLSEDAVRKSFPAAYQWLLDRVKPDRVAKAANNKDAAAYAATWWLFAKPRPAMRVALAGLSRYVATIETAKHRFFVFLDCELVPDQKLRVFATDDAWVLGVLSSRPHCVFALAAGGTLEDRPVYNNSRCFDPFPFPLATKARQTSIRALAEELDAHRKRQQAAHPELTITGMYNVLEKLRSGEALSAKDKVIHEQGLVSVLKKLHDDLDAAVFDAYGWPPDLSDEQILERLVALNAERAAEEKRGLVRWLRPEFQNPTGAKTATQEKFAATQDPDDVPEQAAAPLSAAGTAWPKKLPEQIAAIRDLVARTHEAWTIDKVCTAFKGAKKTDVEEVLESLEALGLLTGYTYKSTRLWKFS